MLFIGTVEFSCVVVFHLLHIGAQSFNLAIQIFNFFMQLGVLFLQSAHLVAAIEQYIKTELGDKTITWATPYELKNSHCQLSFTCEGLSYDILIEIHSFGGKCRFVMGSEFDNLIAGCKKNDHIPCILALESEIRRISCQELLCNW